MPEHVHLLISEPQRATLADAIKSLKQGVSRRLIGDSLHFWQERYYDFNAAIMTSMSRSCDISTAIPCRADCASARKIGSGAAFASMPPDVKVKSQSNPNGRQERASEQ